jgi:N-acetylmuramic acid 6-phosphate etherase
MLMMKRRRQRITERANPAAAHLEEKSAFTILRIINREDHKVAPAAKKVIPQIARAVNLAAEALARGGRLIYLGAGTSGRLGVLDAAECLPTFDTDRVQAVMAGAPKSMFRPSEVSEDDPQLAIRDLQEIRLNRRDVLVGISASGRTPYTLGGMRYARKLGVETIALTCNPDAPLKRVADISIVPVVGPEIIAGSSRMKAGTAHKLVLNMISTATMVRLGRVVSGRMIALRISNRKLRERGLRIVRQATGATASRAASALKRASGNIPVAVLMLRKNLPKAEAQRLLKGELDVAAVLRAASFGPSRIGARK